MIRNGNGQLNQMRTSSRSLKMKAGKLELQVLGATGIWVIKVKQAHRSN